MSSSWRHVGGSGQVHANFSGFWTRFWLLLPELSKFSCILNTRKSPAYSQPSSCLGCNCTVTDWYSGSKQNQTKAQFTINFYFQINPQRLATWERPNPAIIRSRRRDDKIIRDNYLRWPFISIEIILKPVTMTPEEENLFITRFPCCNEKAKLGIIY